MGPAGTGGCHAQGLGLCPVRGPCSAASWFAPQASGVHQPLHIPCPHASAKPPTYASGHSLPHNAAGQLPCRRGSGQSAGHLLPGCFSSALLSPPPSSSDSSVLPRPIVDQGTGLPLLSMSELSPSQGHTGRWDSGSRASSPTRKNPKVYFPSRLYPQTGGCPQREAVCSHSCLGSHPSPPPLPHCPGPQTPRLRPQASESLEVTGRVRAAF